MGNEAIIVLQGIAVVCSHVLEVACEGLAGLEDFSGDQLPLLQGGGRQAVILGGEAEKALSLGPHNLKAGCQGPVGLLSLDDCYELIIPGRILKLGRNILGRGQFGWAQALALRCRGGRRCIRRSRQPRGFIRTG